jgi:catechol 2,3-dioxygenase-like lactoylglutathione lyase family enzyme
LRVRFLPHIAIDVRDYHRAIAFYRDVLEMEIIAHGRRETRLRIGDLHLYVQGGRHEQVYLAFETDRIQEARERLVVAGCTIGEFDGGGFMVADPFGLKFYLSETRLEE